MGARSGRARALLVVCGLVALSVAFIVVSSGDDAVKARSASRAAAPPADIHEGAAELPDLTDLGPRSDERRAALAPLAAEEPPPRAASQGRELTGLLLRPDGGPTGDGHSVWLIELSASGEPDPDGGRAQADLTANGRFRMPWPDWAEHGSALLVGRGPGLAAATLELSGLPGDGVELPLGVGAELTGLVTWLGEPVAGWPVGVDMAYGTPGVFGAGAEGFWHRGAFVVKHRQTHTDDAGRYRLTGLAEAGYDLRVSRVEPSVSPAWEERVVVDGREVNVELGEVQLSVEVTSGGVPLAGAVIIARCGARAAEQVHAGGPVPFTVPADMPVVVEVREAGHRTSITEVPAAGAGSTIEHLVSLEPVTRPRLLVHLPGAADAGIESLPLDTRMKGDGDRRTTPCPIASVTWRRTWPWTWDGERGRPTTS